MEDWVNHEDRLHREGNRQLRDPSRQTFDVQGPSQNLTKSLHQIQHPKPMIPSDVWGEKCPICLKPSPSLAHVALHLRRIAVFTLPRSGEPEEDSTLGDQGSNTANIDDQESVSSLSTFETSDQGVLHEDEANDDWGQWDTNTPRDVVPTEIARQEDVQQLEHTLMGSRLKPHVATSPDCTLYSTSFFSTSLPKQKNNDRPASVAVAAMINLSFYVRIDPLEPDYKDQPARQGRNLFWVPSIVRSEFTRRDGTLFRWMGGIMTVVGTNDPVRCSLNRTHSAATVFTQHPDTPHLLVVPFDAQMRHPHQNSGGWQPLSFQHLRMNDTQRIYSAVSATGDRQHIAAPGSPHWMPQLLPRIYDDRKAGSPRIQAGLIGSLPLLLALAAFSAPPGVLAVVLINCVRSMTWRPHQYQYPAGRKCRCKHE